jgi:hypothetical protein
MAFWDDAVDFVEDVGDAVSDGVDWVVDAAGNVVDAVVQTAEDIAQAAAEAAAAAAEAAADAAQATWTAAQDAYEAVGTATSAVINPVLDEVVSPVGDALLGGLEDSGFFDVVDYASLGIVDMSYGDSGFTLDFGIDDIYGYTFNAGNGGFALSGELGGQHLGASLNDDGIGASAAVGIDWGPLPYTEGHASIEADGDVGAGGEWQGYFPLPGGMVGGHTAAEYQETDDGFRTSWDVTPGIYEPTGEYVGVGTHGSYSEDEDGYQFNVGVHAEAGQDGVVDARASLDYDEARRGDVHTQGVSASAHVEDELTHTSVDGRIGYQHTETSEGDFDTLYAQGRVSAPGVEVGGQVAGTLGPDGSVRVEGSAYGEAEGYRVGAHGSTTFGPDGVRADGGIDELDTPFGSPDDLPDQVPGFGPVPDGLLPDGFLPDDLPRGLPEGLPEGLPGGLPSGVPSFDDLRDRMPDPRSYVDDAVDQGRQYLDDAVDQLPSAPDAPDAPDAPSMPSMPSAPEMPSAPGDPDVPSDDLPF